MPKYTSKSRKVDGWMLTSTAQKLSQKFKLDDLEIEFVPLFFNRKMNEIQETVATIRYYFSPVYKLLF